MASTSLSPIPSLTIFSSSRLRLFLAFREAGAGARARGLCREKRMSGIKISHNYEGWKARSGFTSSTLSLDSFFGDSDDEGNLVEKAKCPPGLREYEAMVILKPDIPEEDRIAFTQRYEEMIVTLGGIGVEVFNRGLIPMAYPIKRRVAMTGELETFEDGVYLLFTFFGKPETVEEIDRTIRKDDLVIRSRVRKTKVLKVKR